jgi:hypothetical protein
MAFWRIRLKFYGFSYLRKIEETGHWEEKSLGAMKDAMVDLGDVAQIDNCGSEVRLQIHKKWEKVLSFHACTSVI